MSLPFLNCCAGGLRREWIVDTTYIFLYLCLRLLYRLGITDVALVEMYARQPFTVLLRLSHIEHRYTRSAHPIRLGQHLPQPARTARDHHHLVIPVYFSRNAVGNPLVEGAEKPKDGDQGGVGAGGAEVEAGGGVADGALAEREQPGDKRVEDAVAEDVGEDVDGEYLHHGHVGG